MPSYTAFLRKIFYLLIFSILNYAVQAQTDTSIQKNLQFVTSISSKTVNSISKQYGNLQNKLDNQSAKLLVNMEKREDKLKRKLSSKDNTKASAIFTKDVKSKYHDLQNKLTDKTISVKQFPLSEYLPGIDSMQTALSFLSNNKYLPADKIKQLQDLNNQLKGLQTQLQKANDVQSFIKERENTIKEQLLNSGVSKQLKAINKEAYYYQARLSEYKALLNDRQKLKEKILETVRTLPVFKKFWQRNSYLASLFPEPAGTNTGQAITGLQTRAVVENLIAQRMGTSTTIAGGATVSNSANPQQLMQQQISAAQCQLNQLKNKLSNLGLNGGSSDMTMPDFKPNDQNTKSFLQRLEYGFNVQSQSSRYFLPATSDLAITVGYKLSDNKRAGFGLSYKMGWGKGLQNGFKGIHLSSEGIGLRSYIDIKSPVKSKSQLLNGVWISGGFEYNYLSSFKSLQELHNNVNVWQRSALLGITKKYKVGKKEGNLQLLYDFLHNQQTPPGTALKFRVGYNF